MELMELMELSQARFNSIIPSVPSSFLGAGGGNRTRMASLEGWNFTTKLHPRSDDSTKSVEMVLRDCRETTQRTATCLQVNNDFLGCLTPFDLEYPLALWFPVLWRIGFETGSDRRAINRHDDVPVLDACP
jgi:hypothetical protein